MLNSDALTRAVDLQHRSYQLLRWMADAVTKGFIRFETAHNYAALPEAAEAWIISHYQDIPKKARPNEKDIPSFSRLFTTFLENSFDLRQDPGKHLYSPDAHCFCPMCSWLVDAPNLKTKKPVAADKRRAQQMKAGTVRAMAVEIGATLTEDAIDVIVSDKALRETLSMVTYARDLLDRLDGRAVGPAALVLWRGFAWTPEGSPKKRFTLSAKEILTCERELAGVIESVLPTQSES